MYTVQYYFESILVLFWENIPIAKYINICHEDILNRFIHSYIQSMGTCQKQAWKAMKKNPDVSALYNSSSI